MKKSRQKLWHICLRYWIEIENAHFIVDFNYSKLNLVIEVDGASHFTPEGIDSDKARTKILEAYL